MNKIWSLALCFSFAATLYADEPPVAAGGYQTLALTADGRVVEWGEWGGALPQVMPYLEHITALSAGQHHILALRNDGTVWAWGDNSQGQLGDSTGINNDRPVQVLGLTGMIAIAAGANHSYALKSDGTIWGWGDNRNGQLGDGTTNDRRSPVLVEGFLGVTAIAAGTTHLLALRKDGSVCSWGLRAETLLPVDGPLFGRIEPLCFNDLSDVMAIAAGGNASYALRRDGTVTAWGGTSCGNAQPVVSLRDRFPILDRVKSISAGGSHLLLLRDDGTVWACGAGISGQLGYGGLDIQSSPLQVSGGLINVRSIGAGFLHSVARGDNGQVWTWGDNSRGQLGTGDTKSRTTPGPVWDGTGELR